MKKLIARAALVLSVIAAGAAIAQARAEDSAKLAIQKLEDDFTDAWNARNASGMVQSFTPNAEISMRLPVFGGTDERPGYFFADRADIATGASRKAFQDYLEKYLRSPAFKFARRRNDNVIIEFLGPTTARVAASFSISGARSSHRIFAGMTITQVEQRSGRWWTTQFDEQMFTVAGH